MAAKKVITEGDLVNEDLKNELVTTKRKRGSQSASVTANLIGKPEEIAQIVRNNVRFFDNRVVKDDDECAERLNVFFREMMASGEIPTVEKLCLSLGTTRKTVLDWENGTMGAGRSHMIKKAKEILAGIDAELVSAGKIPQITYIFRSKNFFGMVDKQEHIITPNNQLGELKDSVEIQARIAATIAED